MKHIISLTLLICISSVYGGQILDKNNKWVSESEVHLYPSEKSYNGVSVDGDVKSLTLLLEATYVDKYLVKDAQLGDIVDHINEKLKEQESKIQVSCSDELRQTKVSFGVLDDSLIYCLGLIMKSSQTYITVDKTNVVIKKLPTIDERVQVKQYKELQSKVGK